MINPKQHGPVACLLLTLLSLALLPLTAIQVLRSLLSRPRASFGINVGPNVRATESKSVESSTAESPRRVALVNGGRMQKSLYVVRALAQQGYRVVLVEERGWGELCATRFSNAVSIFRLVPSGGGQDYVDGLVNIALEESITLFVPCSGAGTTVQDAHAAQLMRKRSGGAIDTLIQDPDLAETLHEKDRFIDLVHELGLEAPQSRIIRSPEEALEYLRQQDVSKGGVLLKAATVLDDVGRNDMTTYPLRDARTSEIDWKGTEARVRRGLAIPISSSTPYAAQEFIGGPGASEWCSHATVWNGQLAAFVCCPSNDMLMTYHNATQTDIGQQALRWTQEFLLRLRKHPRWQDARLTGQFSMDFIHQPALDRLVVIECNPRVHTAVCLLQEQPAFGSALAGECSTLVTPPPKAASISWLGHDIVARFAPRLLPHSLVDSAYGPSASITVAPQDQQQAFDLEQIGQDGAWSSADPLVYLAFYHVQWPALLIRQALLRRKTFSRINISTARIFECN
ncbi:hypothetical protein A4X09_0g2556 [Tilletia walkeri]|uniref:Carbamoyl phosphate synthase ATP-binding domain-containing protein n=1 Tax=Tilletia walkeri TaxID=117179 RepID=A0A8X7NBA2_9BASI|nr:hypothetical protein A4X09_0g2556 [Tilletia walkeri]